MSPSRTRIRVVKLRHISLHKSQLAKLLHNYFQRKTISAEPMADDPKQDSALDGWNMIRDAKIIPVKIRNNESSRADSITNGKKHDKSHDFDDSIQNSNRERFSIYKNPKISPDMIEDVSKL